MDPNPSTANTPPLTARRRALQLLLCPEPDEKAAGTRALSRQLPVGAEEAIAEPPGVPGRPARPVLVAPAQVAQKSMQTTEGRAMLLHALAHIELNAIDLALDVCWRFAGMPERFYLQWLDVAREEALHFELLRDHLRSLGHAYGDFPAHGTLWEMASKTRHDLLARLALVPRTLEARGLDASPAVKARLVGAGDTAAGRIIDTILRDEIGHVAIGNHWFRALCRERGVDPLGTYARLAAEYGAPRLRGPFNLPARRAAGFDDAELQALGRV